MTPKEKAIELYSYYDNLLNKDFIFPIVYDNQLKQCALIAVDEIIQLRKGYFDCKNPMQDESYWQEVKQEIEKL